jgi:hypothetical protein
MPVTYPGGSDRITVEAFLRMPRLISRALTDLTSKRFVADRIFARGTSDQVAGGAALYQRSEVIYPDRPAEEVKPRSQYPRTGWSEQLLAAAVHKYGLEAPISDEAKRRNSMDQVQRANLKLANAVVKFVDTVAMNLLLTDTAVLTDTASGDWSTSGTDIIADIAKWRQTIINQDEGYEPDTLLLNPAQELDLIVDKDIRDALPREGNAPNPSVVTGAPVPILGLRQIIVSPQVPAGKVIILSSNIVGTIADEAPMADENYQAYNPGGNFATIYVKTYRVEDSDESIVRAARFPAMWIAEPKSALVASGA